MSLVTIVLCCAVILGSAHGVSPILSSDAARARRHLPDRCHTSTLLLGRNEGPLCLRSTAGNLGALGTHLRTPGDTSVQGRCASVLAMRGGAGGDIARGDLMGEKSNIVAAVAAKVGMNLHNREDQPLQIIKSWFFQHFDETHVRPRASWRRSAS